MFFFPLQLAEDKGSPACILTPGSGGESVKFHQLWVRNECGGPALAGFI